MGALGAYGAYQALTNKDKDKSAAALAGVSLLAGGKGFFKSRATDFLENLQKTGKVIHPVAPVDAVAGREVPTPEGRTRIVGAQAARPGLTALEQTGKLIGQAPQISRNELIVSGVSAAMAEAAKNPSYLRDLVGPEQAQEILSRSLDIHEAPIRNIDKFLPMGGGINEIYAGAARQVVNNYEGGVLTIPSTGYTNQGLGHGGHIRFDTNPDAVGYFFHYRGGEVTGQDGRPMFGVIEVQSDHGQRRGAPGVPDLPLQKDSEYNVGLAWMLKHAVENGYSEVAFPANIPDLQKVQAWDGATLGFGVHLEKRDGIYQLIRNSTNAPEEMAPRIDKVAKRYLEGGIEKNLKSLGMQTRYEDVKKADGSTGKWLVIKAAGAKYKGVDISQPWFLPAVIAAAGLTKASDELKKFAIPKVVSQ